MKKKTDSQLFKELRIINYIFGLAMIIVFAVTTFIFTEPLGDYWYEFILLFLGIMLISFASQKYFQEHPKARMALMWILTILALLGVAVFFMFTKSIG